MLLAIDVGNTEMKLGLFEPSSDRISHTWRVTTELRRTADEYGVFFTQLFATSGVAIADIHSVVIASVVPKLDNTLEDVVTKFFGVTPVFLEAHRQTLIPIVTDRPAEVGADLVAAAIGGKAQYGAPLIVVSYGTATVFMAISTAGEYCGVAIAPGINISIDALTGRTAKLPQISLDAPERALGRNTIEALQSGFVFGFVGQTEALVRRFRAELGAEARVVATGGLADVMSRQTTIIDVLDPHLSLIGLELYHRSVLPPPSR